MPWRSSPSAEKSGNGRAERRWDENWEGKDWKARTWTSKEAKKEKADRSTDKDSDQARPSGRKAKSHAAETETVTPSKPAARVELVPSLVQSLPTLQLPIDEFRDRILQHIRENRVTHIQGETGCGKSTRLPQFILEDAKHRGEEIRMVVTQPRRMAAVTLAKRVASVLGEEIGQGTVGYRISGDTINGKLCFVTVGYLLQRLVNNPEDFQRYTHVVLDEVHERGVDADLLSLVIKLLMHCCPTVKLIVMSATLQATLFADYFSSLHPGRRSPEVLAVGARCHPVEQLFLDDLQQHFDFSDQKDRRSLENALQAFAGLSKGRGKGKGKKDGRGGDEAGFKRVEPQISEGLMEVTCALVQQLAKPGCTIIVFLPGIADITQLFESLAPLDDVRSFGRPGVVRRSDCPRLRIFALHSMVPRQEQEEVFNEVPKDTGHVVLASNIAESSLTLPSVCAVVDLALRRTVQYDTRRLMCCLVTTWCSQSSCKQRRGRAGRTMPGRALCLVPRRFLESELPAFDPPEMLNAPLTKLYLQAKQLCSTLSRVSDRVQLPPDVHMDISSPKALLNEVVQPPSLSLLDAAIQELSAVGCLTMPTEEAEITPLGQIAVALPCDLRICRLLFLGCLFGCPTDALAMAAGLTGPDPFSTPSLLVLKDQKEYVQKLERSFASRRWCDHGTFSEPIMMHSLFKEWIRAGAPRGAKALGSFVRDWSIIPKKFESLTADATELTVRFLKLLKSGRPRSNLEELLSAMHHKVDKGDDLLRTSGWGNPERIFSSDVDKLRCLLAMAFSDQMLLHLNPRWAPSSGGKKRLEEQLLDLMYKHECDPHNTVGIFVPAGHDEEGVKELCEEMCGEEPEMVIIDEKAKMALAGFAHSTEKEALDHEAVLLWDVPSSIHRLHMFGSGRYRFYVERPKSEEPPVEIFKPVHPFMLQWDVLTNPGGGKKKPPTVKGMCDWRNPMGFACHVDDSKPPAEFVGCCASIQGLEGGAQAFVSGASVLPMRFLPALLSTLCPERWCVAWGVDAGSSEVRGVRILHHELVNLPKNTLAPPVLEAVNALRTGLREALYPASWWAWDGWGTDSRGRHRGRHEERDSELLDLPDLSQLLRELIEVMPDPDSAGVQRPKKMKWPPATTFSQDWEEEDESFLRTLQPLAEREDLRGRTEAGGKDTNFPELVEHLARNGECAISSLPSKIRRTKKQLQKRPDLFVIRPTKKDCFVRLAGTASTEVATSHAKTKAQKGAGGQERPLVDALVRVLTCRGAAVGLGELGSQESLKKLLKKQQADLRKIRQFVAAFPSIFHLGTDASGQVAVTLSGDGVRSLPVVKSSKGGKSGKGGKRSTSGAKHKGSNPSVLTEHITSLCGSSAATAADFDGRVKALLLDVQDKQGTEALDECFENLHEWLSKKGDRSAIGNWPAYITKLVVNWKDRMQ